MRRVGRLKERSRRHGTRAFNRELASALRFGLVLVGIFFGIKTGQVSEKYHEGEG